MHQELVEEDQTFKGNEQTLQQFDNQTTEEIGRLINIANKSKVKLI
jgi:hypothetical protein